MLSSAPRTPVNLAFSLCVDIFAYIILCVFCPKAYRIFVFLFRQGWFLEEQRYLSLNLIWYVSICLVVKTKFHCPISQVSEARKRLFPAEV